MLDEDSCHLGWAVLFHYITSSIYNCAFFKIFVDFFLLIIFDVVFKTVILNCQKKNHCKPKATCTKVDFRETDCKVAGI